MKWITLEELCEKGSSNIAQKDLEGLDGDYPIYGASGFIKNVDYYKQEKPCIAIVKDGAGVGRVMKLPEKSSVIGTMQYIIPKENVNVDYLAFAMEHMNLAKYYTGATIPHIYFKDYCKEKVIERSWEEQHEIAGNLNKVENLIALRKQQVEKLDELVKARFVELFGDPKLNNKGWKSGVISDYFEVKGGKRIPKGMGYSDTKTNHPYLRATDMKNATILEDDIHYISEEVFQHIKRYTVKGGDIYLTNVGVNLGMAGVIPQKFDGASLTENAVKLVPKTENEIDGMFLAHYINSPGIQEYINERKMAVGVPKLAIFRIETMPLLIPPMEVQQHFIAFVEQTDKSKLVIQKSLEQLGTLKKSLMQQYFG